MTEDKQDKNAINNPFTLPYSLCMLKLSVSLFPLPLTSFWICCSLALTSSLLFAAASLASWRACSRPFSCKTNKHIRFRCKTLACLPVQPLPFTRKGEKKYTGSHCLYLVQTALLDVLHGFFSLSQLCLPFCYFAIQLVDLGCNMLWLKSWFELPRPATIRTACRFVFAVQSPLLQTWPHAQHLGSRATAATLICQFRLHTNM